MDPTFGRRGECISRQLFTAAAARKSYTVLKKKSAGDSEDNQLYSVALPNISGNPSVFAVRGTNTEYNGSFLRHWLDFRHNSAAKIADHKLYSSIVR
jgi:hypothetical protein